MAIVEVTIAPMGTATPSISKYVAACHKVLEEATDLKHQLTPMATIIRRMHEVPFAAGAQRVSTLIRVDDRRDKVSTMAGKVKAVTDKLQSGGK